MTVSAPTAQASGVFPSQHSAAFMHSSPSARHGPIAQRATASGPTVQAPEQQPASTAQRSPAGLQPAITRQRMAPPSAGAQRPLQQSLSLAHVSSAT